MHGSRCGLAVTVSRPLTQQCPALFTLAHAMQGNHRLLAVGGFVQGKHLLAHGIGHRAHTLHRRRRVTGQRKERQRIHHDHRAGAARTRSGQLQCNKAPQAVPGQHRLGRHALLDVIGQPLFAGGEEIRLHLGLRRLPGKPRQLHQVALHGGILQGQAGVAPALDATVQARNHQHLTPLANHFHLHALEGVGLRQRRRQQHAQPDQTPCPLPVHAITVVCCVQGTASVPGRCWRPTT